MSCLRFSEKAGFVGGRSGPGLVLLIAAALAGGAEVELPDRDAVIQRAAESGEPFWRRIATGEPYETLEVRRLFFYAQTLCEARQHPQRLARLFELAARAQDRDPNSPGFGNLRWTWRDQRVTDRNAVEFSMNHAASIWLKHKDWMPEPARRALRALLDYSIEGCLRHRVASSYTNIALFNAGNLIVLGEIRDRPQVVEEGCRRLDAVCLWTWQYGTHEYCTPSYYGVDLDGLLFIKTHARQPRARRQAAALLELLWTDIALNWFGPAESLAGAHSRSYDYLSGLGSLDRHMWINGWLSETQGPGTRMIHPVLGQGSVPPGLRQLSLNRLPRLVRQSWGVKLTESRTHMLCPDVTLSCSGAAYGPMDMPLTVDLPGDRRLVRCYFIADGREDPYGKKKYETGSARHMKAKHLEPFWAAAQRNRDALGLVVYRERDLKEEVVTNVQSHLVLRREVDGFWLRGQPLDIPAGTPETQGRVRVGQGDPLVFRCGTAAVGIRLIWSRRQDGEPAVAALVNDGNPYGALRLTLDHRCEDPTAEAGAAFWVRVGSGLETRQDFDRWRTRFERAGPTAVEVSEQSVRLEVPGEDGPVSVTASAPFGRGGGVHLVPEPTRGALELDGKEIGRPLLESIEPIRSYRQKMKALGALDVPADRGVYWEAEDTLLFPGMTEGQDAEASGGRYVWQPKDDPIGRLAGNATRTLRVAKAGRYWLWGRVLAPDPQTDSFYVQVLGETGDLIPPAAWHTGHNNTWCWRCVALNKAEQPTPLELPAGLCRLRLHAREPGTKIDRLLLTPDPNETPE